MLPGPLSSASEPAYLSIIIDDIGNNRTRAKRAFSLPGPVAFAVLPNARYATSLSETAHLLSKEVIIHLPMTNLANQPIGPGGLTDTLNKQDFLAAIEAAIKKVPYAKGINNHTGSYLTQQKRQMTWLMDEIKQRDFFFIDSRTTDKTVAEQIAQQKHVFSSSRDVFLDNDPSYLEIDLAFNRLVKVAKKKGTAIGIGHPHPHTLDYLEKAIPQLNQHGVEIISVSALIAIQQVKQAKSTATAE